VTPVAGRAAERSGVRSRCLVLILAAIAAAGCSAPGHPAPPRPAPTHATPDPGNVTALLRVAQAFNDAYDSGGYGAVYDRWDARSQAIISRAEYIRRHRACPTAPTGAAARVQDATRGPGSTWHVRYEISGVQLVDTWFYVRRRWVFDIVLSNPDAARQYRLPFARYAAAVGCSVH
jgi:hypothetical protein